MTRSPALSAAQRYLTHPDAVVPLDGPVSPVGLATTIAVGLGGAGAYLGLTALAFAEVGGPDVALLRLVAVPAIAAALTFPPLLLLTTLQGRQPAPLRLAAVAAAGPTVAGIWLGAGTPLLALFAMTGRVDWAFGLLHVAMLSTALFAGAWASISNGRQANDAAPHTLVLLGHYAFTVWTAAALTAHLA